MNFHQHHSFKKYLQTVPGTPSFLAGQWGKYKKWGCFWNHPLCVHQAARRPRVTPLLRGGGIAPVACPPATLPSCYSPRSIGQGSLRLTSFHLNTFYNFDSTQQLPDLNVPMPEVRHVSLRWWLCLLSRARSGGKGLRWQPLWLLLCHDLSWAGFADRGFDHVLSMEWPLTSYSNFPRFNFLVSEVGIIIALI